MRHSIIRPLLGASGGVLHEQTGRLFLCARCQAQVLVCSQCDHGQRNCAAGCGDMTRLSLQREAGMRYQQGHAGRHKHASQFPGYPCQCCAAWQRITSGNLARFTVPIAMQSYRLGVHRALRHRHCPQRRAYAGLALPLLPVTVSGASAPMFLPHIRWWCDGRCP
jgi:hypothetical protein